MLGMAHALLPGMARRNSKQNDDAKKAALYPAARAEAQAKADATGMDQGLEWNPIFKHFNSFGLPGRQYRQGHERRCEVVSPTDLSKCLPGHGPC